MLNEYIIVKLIEHLNVFTKELNTTINILKKRIVIEPADCGIDHYDVPKQIVEQHPSFLNEDTNLIELNKIFSEVASKKEYDPYSNETITTKTTALINDIITYALSIPLQQNTDIALTYSNKDIEKINKNTITQQTIHMGTALGDFNKGKKEYCWNWYVFLTWYPGRDNVYVDGNNNDMAKFVHDATAVKIATTQEGWIDVLEKIANLTKPKQNWVPTMKSNDTDRMFKSIIFWLSRQFIYEQQFERIKNAFINIASNFSEGTSNHYKETQEAAAEKKAKA